MAKKSKPAGSWVKCTAAMTLRPRGTDAVEHLWPGLVVNLDRVLTKASGERPAFTVGDALRGREDCFVPSDGPGTEDEPVAAPDPAPKEQE